MAHRVIHSWADIEHRLDVYGPVNNRRRDKDGYIKLYHNEYLGKVEGRSVFKHSYICFEHVYTFLSANKDIVLADDEVIDHINNIHDDNRLENLQVLTIAQNNAKRLEVDHSKESVGAKISAKAKKTFTKEQVLDIRRRFAEGQTQMQIAKAYGVYLKLIWLIVHNKTYTRWH
jgi:hypothetical protein